MNILLRILERFRSENPEIDVRLSFGDTTEVLDNLVDRVVDLGVLRGFVPPAVYEVEPLCPDQIMFVVSSVHPAASGAGMTLADVADIPLILPGPNSTTRAFVIDLFRKSGLSPRVAMEFNSTEHTKKAVEANLGAGIISRWVVEQELREGLLVALDVEGFPLVRAYQLVRRKGSAATPAVARLLNTVEECRPELHFQD